MYIENPKDAIRKWLELINKFNKVVEYKINTQKSLAFLYINNARLEREIKETIPFTTATKKIKYQGINLPRRQKTVSRKLLRKMLKFAPTLRSSLYTLYSFLQKQTSNKPVPFTLLIFRWAQNVALSPSEVLFFHRVLRDDDLSCGHVRHTHIDPASGQTASWSRRTAKHRHAVHSSYLFRRVPMPQKRPERPLWCRLGDNTRQMTRGQGRCCGVQETAVNV